MTRSKWRSWARRGPSRPRVAAVLAAALSVGGLGAWLASDLDSAWAEAEDADYPERFAAADRGRVAVGAAFCGQCHGGPKVNRTRADGSAMESFRRWRADGEGPHFRSYETLATDRSHRMAELAHAADGKGADPRARPDCLRCHSFGAGEAFEGVAEDGRRGALKQGAFAAGREGVSCESCHGRAAGLPISFDDKGAVRGTVEGYLTEHQIPTWRESDRWEALGQYDTRKLSRWADRCLPCHVADGQGLGHDLYAAGHPELTFELANDALGVPRHWRDSRLLLEGEDPRFFYARLWAVGQAKRLLTEVDALIAAPAAPANQALDYARFDCTACHHTVTRRGLTPEADPRQRAKLVKRGLGLLARTDAPGWSGGSTWAVAGPWVRAAHPDLAVDFTRGMTALYRVVSVGDRAGAAREAAALRPLVASLADAAERTAWSEARALEVLRAIAGDGERIAALGYRASDQGVRALWALYRLSYASADPLPAGHDKVLASLAALQEELGRGPDGFRPFRFAAELRALGDLLPGAD